MSKRKPITLAAQMARLFKAAAVASFVLGLLIAINVATTPAPPPGDYVTLLIVLFVIPVGLVVFAVMMTHMDSKNQREDS